jgi:hypothetical protein
MSNLDQIKARMEAEFARQGVTAEVTFISSKMFSILCDDAAQFAKAKAMMKAANQWLDSEECDDEIGHCAYYNF